MGLKQNLLRGIFEFGFEKPTAIQQRAIVPMTSGRDVIAQAQSGTGKTAMLSISALQVVNVHSREVQVLCLNPTRELAVQVTRRTQRPSNTCSNMHTDSQSCKRDRRCHEYPGAPLHRWKIHRRRYQAPRSRRAHRQRHPRPSFDMIRRRNLRTDSIQLLLLDEVGFFCRSLVMLHRSPVAPGR